ncbi:MAG: hypothetical protein R3338_13685, partial [Thermoanaerobaculia bacterium]|nr:hypothetical protein [Thermoanaerobaculia bacterium]
MRGRLRKAVVVALASLVSVTLAATEEEAPSSFALQSPDYSKEALLEIVRTEEIEVDVFEDRIEVRWQDWILRFLPIVMPLTLDDGSGGSAQFSEPVSALSLLGVDYPLAGPAGDETPPLG